MTVRSGVSTTQQTHTSADSNFFTGDDCSGPRRDHAYKPFVTLSLRSVPAAAGLVDNTRALQTAAARIRYCTTGTVHNRRTVLFVSTTGALESHNQQQMAADGKQGHQSSDEV